jgi:hypothetical protein
LDEGILHLDERRARQLLLVRAIEDADAQGRLVGEVEREQLEREALAASRDGADGIDFGEYLQQRARRFLALVEGRQPRIAALQDLEPWRRLVLAVLPLVACVLGAALDRIDNPRQVNMLSPPMFGVLAWNVVVYVLLLASVVVPRRWLPQVRLDFLHRWFAAGPAPGRSGRVRAEVLARFHQHWWRATASQQALWWKELLHLCAAGWAAGIALSIVIGGVVREYRVGWESTLLDVGQVHAILDFLFAPVAALLPLQPFSIADLQRMAFHAPAVVGVADARRWVWMSVALLGLVVVLPRALLAAWAGWQRHRRARAVGIDLRDPYFVQLLARVSPARITLSLVASPGAGREAVLRMLRQLAGQAPPRDGAPCTVLSTPKGDVLRVFEVPPGFRPPAPTVAAHANGTAAAQAWLQDLLGRFRTASRGRENDAVQATLADTDLLLLVPSDPADLQEWARLLHWVAQPALVLAPGDDAQPYADATHRLAIPGDVLLLEECTGHWLDDAVWLEAATACIAASKRAGFQRLAATWSERNDARFARAMRLLASELVRIARDSEAAGAAPLRLREWMDAGERGAAQRARELARGVLLARVREGERGVLAELVQLHRNGEPVAALAASRMESGFLEHHVIDSPQAGMAGAATGAALGAGIDLLAGGLTLGAAAALGAVIGGGAGYAAAAWKNRGAPREPQLQVSDELLQTLAEGLLLAYLAVAHRRLQGSGELPAAWRSEVVAAVATRRAELAALWQQARTAMDPEACVAPLAGELEGLARGLLARV